MTSLSSSPFVSNTNRHSRASFDARRVFTRSPFPAVAATGRAGTQSIELDLSFSRSDAAPLFAPLTPDADCNYILHPRDRSLYAWFHSVGTVLTLLALGAACVALLVG